jgi:acrylyl-CoA reductase (NADPH)
VIDNVGGSSLGNILASIGYRGSCAAVGNAGGIGFQATVIPFLLRGINLLGIDSATCPFERRVTAWSRLVRDLPMAKLEAMTNVIALGSVTDVATEILKGHVRGRTVIDVNQ